MATQMILETVAVNLKLNNGTTTTGAVRTVNLPIGGSSTRTLSKSEFTTDQTAFATKVLAISTAVSRVLSKSVYDTQLVETSQVTN